jgi:hypothetical protein
MRMQIHFILQVYYPMQFVLLLTCSSIQMRGKVGTIGEAATRHEGVKFESQMTRLFLKLGLERLVGSPGVNLGLDAAEAHELSVKLDGMNKLAGPKPGGNITIT